VTNGYTLGDRFVFWRCTMCRNVAEWTGPPGMLPVCCHCGAEDKPYRKAECGVYTVTSVGSAELPWEVERDG
jgi:hypothetical protein